MQIIGHRGAAGLALENSKTAFELAAKLGIDVELAVRQTADDVLVVNHDSSLKRTTGDQRRIRQHSWNDLKNVKLNDGSPLLRLEGALNILKGHKVMIEVKDRGSINALLRALDSQPGSSVIIASFHHRELLKLKKQAPRLACYPLARFWPHEVISFSHRNHLEGIGIPYWTLNPLSYWHIRHAGLQAYTYTANGRWLIKFIHRFYPRVAICTNFPNQAMPANSKP
jgi:glycerophosphoryl diester phosphodiesterase